MSTESTPASQASQALDDVRAALAEYDQSANLHALKLLGIGLLLGSFLGALVSTLIFLH